MPHPYAYHLAFGLALTLAAEGAAAFASDEDESREVHAPPIWKDSGDVLDRARRASQSGEILTLAEILRRVRARTPGRVLNAELEREGGPWIYEIRLLDPSGRLFRLKIDAQSGKTVESIEGP
jgi:uncharacterized membrane protein YkoI